MDNIDMLPPHLRAASLSEQEIVLPHHEALQAIQILQAAGWAVFAWEGWVKHPNGAHGHHGDYQGTVDLRPCPGEAWAGFIQRAGDFCKSTMLNDQLRFDNDPACRGCTLYFCLAAGPEPSKAWP
jgi:hypothetical protein